MAETMTTAEEVHHWAEHLDALSAQLAPRFARPELRRRAAAYLKGLLGDAQRKNSWQLAEYLGDAKPYGVQHLLGRARWDADAVRDDLRCYVARHLADPQAVLVVDETGFLKKGTKSAGVQRQYSGTAGRIENCQVGVFVALASRHGRAFIDRALYLPQQWAEDAQRRRAARIPPEVTFATKPQLAAAMLRRAWSAGLRPSWVSADEVYGNDSKFRRFLEENNQPYVLAVQSNQRLWVNVEQVRVEQLAERFTARQWRRCSAGEGSKGPRWYDWAVQPFGAIDERGWRLWLLVRRQCEAPHERAYYLCRGPAQTPWRELVRVAGMRWAIEEGFEGAKGECGLDQYEVRSWVGWYRHITLALLAHALLAAIRRAGAEAEEEKKGRKRG